MIAPILIDFISENSNIFILLILLILLTLIAPMFFRLLSDVSNKKKSIDYLQNRILELSNEDFLRQMTTENEIKNNFHSKHVLIINILILIIKEATSNHLRTLVLKKSQLTLEDDYGITDDTKWILELRYFLEKVVFPTVEVECEKIKLDLYNDSELSNIGADKFQDVIFNEILILIQNFEDSNLDLLSCNEYSKVKTGYDYETYVSELLKNHGWCSKVTQGSGDQGADIIATKDGRKIILQCKLYSTKVGNKSVQEAYAAKGFYDCDEAFVISNNQFTRSAKELGNKLNIRLLNHHEIDMI